MNKLLLAGYYGFDNSGDDAILRSMVDNLKESSNDYELTVLSNSPSSTSIDYGVNSVNRFSIKGVYHAMKEADVFVFGGGSLLQDVTSTRSLFYYLALLNLAIVMNRKIFIFANGIGPIEGKFNRWVTKKTLSKVDTITLRDQDSYNYVKELGVVDNRIKITADPVFMLEAAGDDRVDEILNKEGIDLTIPTIAISLRDWEPSKNLNLEIAQLCDQLKGEDIQILLVPMHYPYDLEYLQVVKDQSSNNNIQILKNQYQVEEIIGILSRCKAAMAMRLHAVIYSAVAQIPIIGLVYDPKVYGLIQELDIKEYIDSYIN